MKKIIDLNGTWKFAPTHDQKQTNDHDVIASKLPLYSNSNLVRTGWENVKVPGVWQKYAEKYSVYEGVCWFYREFETDDVYEKAFLIFKGVNYRAEVYVNNQFVGAHESAYTEFSFDISKYLQKGTNSIAVQVDNRPLVVKWPNDWGYGVYGGIHRDVFVEAYKDDCIYDIEVTPDYDIENKKGILSVCGKTDGNGNVVVRVGDTAFAVKALNGAFDERLAFENITPWSPENPALYDMSVSFNEEIYKECKIGFRNVKCADRKILLNGTSVEIKGACYLCDSPNTGLSMNKEEMKKDLLCMKEANVNSVRTHYPMSDSFYELCDELGIMVWIEPNIYCSKPKENETNTVFKRQDFVDVAVSMTEEMVKGARPFASVIIYGIGNECNTDHAEAIPFFEKISKTVRQADGTRLVGYASFYDCIGKISHTIDVMGINSYFAWYDVINTFTIDDERNGIMRVAEVSGLGNMIENVAEKLDSDMPILLTEFGADSVPGYISPECALWSENYHAQVIEKVIAVGKELSCVAGGYVFAFTDYLDPSKPMNGRWNGQNLKGMISYEREKKLPYYALKKAYAK